VATSSCSVVSTVGAAESRCITVSAAAPAVSTQVTALSQGLKKAGFRSESLYRLQVFR
jgi:hypothetical protein